jgi:hypothetical protein
LLVELRHPVPFSASPTLWASMGAVPVSERAVLHWDGTRGAATLGDHVPHVVKLRAQEQMFRVHAGRVIATVKHGKGAWRTKSQCPCHAMCEGLEPRAEASVSNPYPSVAFAVSMPRPRPAIVWARPAHVGPEPSGLSVVQHHAANSLTY